MLFRSIPFIVLVYVSLLPFVQAPSARAFSLMNFKNYAELWHNDLISQVMRNTVVMVVATSTMTVAFSFAISLVIVRSRFWGRKILDQLSFLPHAIPGIVMGLSFFWVFLQADKVGIPIHGGVWAISLAFTERTPLPPAKVVELAQKEKNRYSLTPDMRLIVRLDSMNWPNIYDELLRLKTLCPQIGRAHV